ncbi:Serine/threonine-protein kinase PknD [Stieleria neptunia]|uniref:Serine/threonine-protein kinase PknD n=1 Tax=Stieleria neptunia TaxID=2527979 RepID=A0A518HLD5_9BACT|nr:serine/threonine-protein kinase [Stieleria neptunia]QDV41657.1 Serine/threonine-protein kinase PknD [Stieleria neptunia]
MALSVDEIATHAISLDNPVEREVYLAAACGADQSLRKRVDALLAALESADDASFLATGLFGRDRSADQPEDLAEDGSAETGNTSNDSGDRFELRSKHAVGGLGEVWVAWDRQLGREVALKQMRPEWAGNFNAAARFRREAEITGFLEHPGVVPIYALGQQADRRPFYAMQFIRGRTLQQVVEEQLRRPATPSALASQDRSPRWYDTASLRKILDHFVDVCQTIDYAHSRQVVHRDLKPANIMLGTYGRTLVVDWGLAKWLDPSLRPSDSPGTEKEIDQQIDATLSLANQNDSSVDETCQGTTLGTPRYMSPEQAAGMIDQIGPAADIYCLGATLYFILTGQAPHAGEADLQSTFNRIIEGRFDPPMKVRHEIPGALQAIIMKSMATRMSDRYASAGDLAEDVQKYLTDQPISVFTDPPIERTLRWARNHRAWTAALAVGLLLTFFGTIAGLMVRGEMNRRAMEAARIETENEREIRFQEETRRLEAVAASGAAIQRSEAALAESRYADAAALIGVAIDRMENQDSLAGQRESLIMRRDRLRRLGQFHALEREGEDLKHLSRSTEAAVLLQASLDELGFWQSDTWWDDMPDDDLSALQRDRLRWKVYRVLTTLNALYVTKMVVAMGSDPDGGSPSTLKMIRSYLSSSIGKREARAALELSKRIETFRGCEAARWLGSIASFRISGGKRVEPAELGPPRNPADGLSLAIFSLIASVDPNYRSWFKNYGDTFMEPTDDDPADRAIDVALESLRRVSDRAPDDSRIHLTIAQAYYLKAQRAESNDEFDTALEYYELSRGEYGRCIAIRPGAAFVVADRSTVALRQAVLMRDHPRSNPNHRRRSKELLRTSFRDASQAKRLAPDAYWVYWHVGATAAELGQTDTAIEAFFRAVETGLDLQDTLDGPLVRLDDLRGRAQAIEFAYQGSDRISNLTGPDRAASRRASLIASLEYSRGNRKPARIWSAQAIELDGDNSRAHQIAGWCALHDQAWETAQRHFENAIRLSPDDAVSLIGAARVAEQIDAQESITQPSQSGRLEQSDTWYRAAIDAAVSQRHRSTAWFGLAKQALQRGTLDEAIAAIESARTLDPACDVSQFLDLTRTEARRLLLRARAASDESEKQQALGQIQALKTFLDKITSLPIASVNQIVDSSSDRPPATLPLLGGDFELPLETYWQLESASPSGNSDEPMLGGSPPLAVVADDARSDDASSNNSCLAIRRTERERPAGSWSLSQTIPATTGQDYRVAARVQSQDAAQQTAQLVVRHAGDELLRLDLAGERNTWTRRAGEFSIPRTDASIVSLQIRIEITDPKFGSVLLDEIKVTRIE